MRLLTILNFSGGKQSTCLLEMVLRGEIEKPRKFAVLNADPGMENKRTYEIVAEMKARCEEQGIYFKTVPGPNLLKDLLSLANGTWGKNRIDNPPYYTKSMDGKTGILKQKCTAYYKIAPMDREIRRILKDWYRIKIKTARIMEGAVEKWIGLASDEVHRIKPAPRKYQVFEYPLVKLGMTSTDVINYFCKRGLPMPPRSVCNACFSNGLRFFKDMRDNRPEEFEQAVMVDEAIRHGIPGVRDECYVSSTCIPLRTLAEMNFNLGNIKEQDAHSCNTGYCFN